MGLITAAGASLSSVLGDQWKEYFYCPEMDADVLVKKGQRHNGKSGLLNRGGSENVITNGSTIVVNEGQCMIIVDQGAIVDVCAQPGAYTYDTSTEPSVFTGGLGAGLAASFEQFKARFTYGGVTAHDQRIYYFNTKDIIGNKYGTANPVPFRVVDTNIGLDVDIAIRCFGEYAYRISDPILFYKNVCGNVNSDYTRDRIENQLRTELLTALQPAFGKISEMGIRYSSVVNHTTDMANALNEVLSDSWGAKYGIVITAFGISSLKASEEDEKMIKELQKTAVFQQAAEQTRLPCTLWVSSSRQPRRPRCRPDPAGSALSAVPRAIRANSAASADLPSRQKAGSALSAVQKATRVSSAASAVHPSRWKTRHGHALSAATKATRASSAASAELLRREK